jgi:hypothetical protein
MTEQDQKIELTPEQQDPYRARPEHFEVVSPDEIASRTQPFHGQRGDSNREEAELLAKRKAQGKGVDLPPRTDDAGPPHINSRHVPPAFKQRRTR